MRLQIRTSIWTTPKVPVKIINETSYDSTIENIVKGNYLNILKTFLSLMFIILLFPVMKI